MTQSAASANAPEDPPGPGGGAGTSPISRHPVTAATIAILVAGSIICTLYVPIYASITPKIGSWPFFYFYLLAYMPAVALALWIANLLQRRLRGAGASEAGSSEEAVGQ